MQDYGWRELSEWRLTWELYRKRYNDCPAASGDKR